MKRFLFTSSLLVAGVLLLSAPAGAQSGRYYDDDIYSTGESARGSDRASSTQRQEQPSETYASSNARSYSADGYADDGFTDGGARSFGADYGSDYIDYDDDFYYATRFRRFSDPFWGRGYWSAFNNPFWYDPFWYDPFWGYNPWMFRPGVSVGWGWGGPGWGGGPFWSSGWGWNTWIGFSAFNSCWGYPAWAGGWGGSPWMGFNSGFYSGYWNGYYAGLNNGFYGGGLGGNNWNGGWRATSYGPRQSLTTIGSPRGVRNAFNGGQRTAFAPAGVSSAPLTNPRGNRREFANPQPGAGRSGVVASPDAVRTAPGSVTRPERGSFGQPSRDGRTVDAVAPASADRPTRFDRGSVTAPAAGDRTVRDRYQTPDRVMSDAPMRSGRDAEVPVRTTPSYEPPRTYELPRYEQPRYEQPRTFERAEPSTRPSFGGDRPAAAPTYERSQPQRSFDRGNRGGFFNGGGSERSAPPVRSAPRFESAPRYEAPRYQPAPRYQSAPRMSAPSPAPSRSFGGGNSGGAMPGRGGVLRR